MLTTDSVLDCGQMYSVHVYGNVYVTWDYKVFGCTIPWVFLNVNCALTMLDYTAISERFNFEYKSSALT